ncbi:MAG: tetratricopeptide repeat protein [Patescibacteria group bacterium]
MSNFVEKLKRFFLSDNFSFGLILGLTFLLPMFFLPATGVSLDVGKMFLISVITLVAFVLWITNCFTKSSVKIPKSFLLGALFLVSLIVVVATAVSPVRMVSFFGQGVEVGTASFMVVAFLLTFVVSLAADSNNKIFRFYLALFSSFVLIAGYHAVRLFAGPDVLSFGLFNDIRSNPIGGWNNLSIFFGLILTLSLLTLEIIQIGKVYKFLLYVVLVVSLFFLAVINFTTSWIVLALISAILFGYRIYLNKFKRAGSKPEEANLLSGGGIPWVPLVVFVVSVVLALTSGTLGNKLPSYFKTAQIEVRPSWIATADIARNTLKENLLLGSGPNRFSNEWQTYRPEALNNTVFWAADFNAGIGFIPTFVVTTGLLGGILWIVFLAVFLYSGIRAMFSSGANMISKYLIWSSFLSAAYLWAFSIFYVPSLTITGLTFIMTGIFVAVSLNNSAGKFEFSLPKNQKLKLVSILVSVFLVVASVSLGYIFVKNTVAAVYFGKAMEILNSGGDIDTGEKALLKAISMNPIDTYKRVLSQFFAYKMNNLLQQKDLNPEIARPQFINFMSNAIQSAKQAVSYDETSYSNWINLGIVYETLVPIGIGGAYEEARKSYEKAIELSPKNPSTYLVLARLEISNKNPKTAREYLNKAIALKSNYTEALFSLSQIEIREGNTKEAISKTEYASSLNPDNAGLFFQLGLLKYTAKDYKGAIVALERATTIIPDYANAMYFLGLSYDNVGRKGDAIRQFIRIGELNSDNQEVKKILKNLTGGKDAFAGISPPDNAPESKKSPPVNETKKAR